MFTTKKFLILCTVFIGSLMYSQVVDSTQIFKKTVNQYSEERFLTQQYYYNPANKSDYSSLSFSELKISYHNEKKNIYRQQLGSGENGFTISADSYNKTKKNNFLWGNASYSNFNLKNIKWNEDLDYERVAPYILSDSVGGNKKLEVYQFGGGYGKQFNKFSYGLEANYTAKMASRNVDPRSKNTSSDLILKAGLNYDVYKKLQIGVFGELNLYTQTGSVRFVSTVSKPLIYQMVGFGYSNNFFSSEYASVVFDELGYQFGGHISNNKGKDFYIKASYKKSSNLKSIQPKNANGFRDASDLENEHQYVEGAKFFNFGKHRTGLLLSYSSNISTGYEFGYTNNTELIQQLYRRAAYKRENYNSTAKLFYQFTNDDLVMTLVPFINYNETIERRIYPFTGQKYDALTFGIDGNFQKELTNNQVISCKPQFFYRKVNNAINVLDTNLRASIVEWITQDYRFLTSDVTTYGASLRYDLKLEKLPAFFVTGEWIGQNIQEKNNNFVGASVGITF